MHSRRLYVIVGFLLCILLLYFASNNTRETVPIYPEDVRQVLHQLPDSILLYEAPYVNSIDHGYQFRFSTTATIEEIQKHYNPILQKMRFSAQPTGHGMLDENGREIQLRWWATAGEWHSISMSLEDATLYIYYVHGYFR